MSGCWAEHSMAGARQQHSAPDQLACTGAGLLLEVQRPGRAVAAHWCSACPSRPASTSIPKSTINPGRRHCCFRTSGAAPYCCTGMSHVVLPARCHKPPAWQPCHAHRAAPALWLAAHLSFPTASAMAMNSTTSNPAYKGPCAVCSAIPHTVPTYTACLAVSRAAASPPSPHTSAATPLTCSM